MAVPAVVAKGLHVELGDSEVISDLNLSLPSGAYLGIVGPASGGKSVLLKTLVGLVAARSGSLSVLGTEVVGCSESKLMTLRRGIGMLFQNYALFDFLTVGENVAFPLRRMGELGDVEIEELVQERLRAVGLDGNAERFPSELSGGMKKRVGIARATIARPQLVIYDEPTAGLDPVTSSKIYDLIDADREETGCTVLAVSSDIESLRKYAPTLALIHQGKMRYFGASDAISESDDEVVTQFMSGSDEGPL